MANKKHPQPKVKPPKRLYYRLSEAAKELTKYFGEEITEDDLVHWGTIESAYLLVVITKDGGVKWDCVEGAVIYGENEKGYDYVDLNVMNASDGKRELFFIKPFIEWGIDGSPTFGVLRGFDCHAIEVQGAIKNNLFLFLDCLQVQDFGFINLVGKSRPYAPFNDKRVSLVFSGVNITKADLFVSAEEVERIKRGEEPDRLPEEEQNSMAKLMRQPRPQRVRSEYLLIAALLADRKPTSAKDLEKAAHSIGVELSDDTIRSIIREVQRVAPGLPNFET